MAKKNKFIGFLKKNWLGAILGMGAGMFYNGVLQFRTVGSATPIYLIIGGLLGAWIQSKVRK